MSVGALLQKLPSVSSPKKRLGFKEKLKWTAIPLIIFYILGEVKLFGLGQASDIFGEQLRAIVASQLGTIISLGIGPIVTASIILQLLNGAKVLHFDTSTEEGRATYQGAQKALAIVFTIFEGAMLVGSGQFSPSAAIIASKGMFFANSLLVFQIFLGGMLIIYLDEIISKWGFGSGIGLFIAGGVSKEIMVRALNPLRPGVGQPIIGAIPAFLQSLAQGTFQFIRLNQNDMFALTACIIVFVICLYAQSVKVEVPLSYGRVRGLSRRYPLPFIYASNMPVIFTAAFIANLRFWTAILQRTGFSFLGHFDAAGNAQGPIFYLLPYNNFAKDLIFGTFAMRDLAHAGVYFAVMVIGSIIFAKLWVGISGMSSDGLADRLMSSGMMIPGFRSDKRVIQRVLDRYVPYLTIMGGAFVGALAAGADFTGSLGGGTGILLTVGIIYHLYEEIASEQLLEMHPAIRSFIGDHGVI